MAAAAALVHHPKAIIKVRAIRGVNLAVRDHSSSDPYVVFTMGNQKVHTHVIHKNLNPHWTDELQLLAQDPIVPMRADVFDKDPFKDDPMGHVEIDIQPLIQALTYYLDCFPNYDGLYKQLPPTRENCYVGPSNINRIGKFFVQDLHLKLKDVEKGELMLQLVCGLAHPI